MNRLPILIATGLMLWAAAATQPADLPDRLVELPEPALEGTDPEIRAQLEETRSLLAEALARPESDPAELAEVYGRLGQLCLLYGFAETSAAAFGNAAALAPADFRWPYSIGVLHERAGEWAAARARYATAFEIRPDYPPTLLRLAEAAFQLEDDAEAERRYRQALTVRELAAAAHVGLGRLAQRRERLDDAVSNFTLALELQPEATAVHYRLALAFRDLGRPDRAREHLERRGDRRVSFPDPLIDDLATLAAGAGYHVFVAARAATRGDLELAEEHYRQALAADPDHATARHALAVVLARRGELTSAIEELERVLESRPDSPTALLQLGSALASQGDLARAATPLQRAVELAPDLRDARLTLATVLTALGRHRQARTHFERAIELAPEDLQARIGLAESLAAAGEHTEAARRYAEAVALDPKSEEAQFHRATNLILAGRYGEALDGLEEGLTALPESPALRNALARLLATCPDDAVRDGQRALALARELFSEQASPPHAETLAMTLAEVGRFQEAARLQRQLLEAARAAGRTDLVERLGKRLDLYERGEPCRAPWLDEGAA